MKDFFFRILGIKYGKFIKYIPQLLHEEPLYVCDDNLYTAGQLLSKGWKIGRTPSYFNWQKNQKKY